MIAFAYYLLKVILCSGILYGYYLLALRNRIYHHWNRYYLLVTVMLSVFLPMISIPVGQQEDPGRYEAVRILELVTTSDAFVEELDRSSMIHLSAEQWTSLAYALVSIFFLSTLAISLLRIRKLLQQHEQHPIGAFRFVNTREKGTPFSFLSYIFWHEDIRLESPAGQQILKHEMVHIHEKHTYDKLCMSIILIPFWCNPFFWVIRREMAMIHEFIADSKSVEGRDTAAFAAMILEAAYPGQSMLLANAFFHSPIKRRLKMLLRSDNPSTNYLTRILALPLLFMVVAAFTLKPEGRNTGMITGEAGTTQTITIVIDAGHGGDDPGVRSEDGKFTEKDITLAIARQIRDLNTNPALRIVLSREKDERQDLKMKVEKALALKADAFISIHINASGPKNKGNDETRSGFEIFLGSRNNANQQGSRILGSLLSEEIAKSYKTLDSLRTRSAGIYVLDAPQINYPAAIIECGYLTNAKDRDFITRKDNQQQIAKRILDALERFAAGKNLVSVRQHAMSNIRFDTIQMNGTPTTGNNVNSFKNMKMTIQSDDSLWTGKRTPLVIINGKLIQPSTLINKTITADSAVFYSKNDMQAIRRYGKDGKNGVLLFYNAHMEDAPDKNRRELMIRSGIEVHIDSLPRDQKLGTSIMRIKGNTTEPIIIIDGEKIGRMTPEGIDALIQPTEIETIDVLKGESAVTKYGEDGKQGVILIRSKSGAWKNPRKGNNPQNENNPIVIINGIKAVGYTGGDLDQLIDPKEIATINVLKGESAVTKYGEDGKQGVIEIRTNSKNQPKGDMPKHEEDPIVIINGIKAGRSASRDLDQLIAPSEIASINILKGESAVTKYGEDGKQGVIQIRTKNGYDPKDLSGKIGKKAQVTYIQYDEGAPSPNTALKVSRQATYIQYEENTPAFTKVDVAPSFPGGQNAMMAYIKSKLKNSSAFGSSDNASKGKIGLWFIVDSFGKLSAFSILSEGTNNIELAKAVIEILKKGPSWEPGKQNGKNVKVVQKVHFKN